MPWLSLLSTLLPIILTPGHPHAAEAHAVLTDAHAAGPVPHPDKTIEVLTRALDLCLRARALSNAPGNATTDALTAALAGLVAPK